MEQLPTPSAQRNLANRVLPPQPVQAAIVIASFTALLYLIELVDQLFFAGHLDRFGIAPRHLTGLEGVVFAPLLHNGWAHLVGNTLPVLLFGFLAMAGGLGQWIAVTVMIWLVSGLGVWLISPSGAITVGASGVAFGWLAFLLVRGIFNRSVKQILVAVVLLFFYGGTLWGLLPGNPQISWQAHVFGALGGLLAAWLGAKATASQRAKAASPPSLPGSLAA